MLRLALAPLRFMLVVDTPDRLGAAPYLCIVCLVCRVGPRYSATVFAYGQTGSGKTHSMLGTGGARRAGDLDGVIPSVAGEVRVCTAA